jgi:hypothetical protein
MFVIVIRSDFVDKANLEAHGFINATVWSVNMCAPSQSTAVQYCTHVCKARPVGQIPVESQHTLPLLLGEVHCYEARIRNTIKIILPVCLNVN